MNKYQTSLLHITPFVYQEGKKEINDENLKHLANLQELVNWYEAFEKIGTDYTKKMIERYLENENKNI